MEQKHLVGFASLFWGQTNAYFNLGKMSTVWKPLTVDVFLAHLKGELELGVYCTNDQNLSYWGCVDFDAPEKTKQQDSLAYQAALQLRSKYAEYGIQAWIERSRNKGYHVWVFPDRPMPARHLRQCQLSLLSELGMSGIEVNPKQENLWNTSIPKTAPSNRRFGIGNLVRIPYSPLATPGRMCMLDHGRSLPLPVWLPEALSTRPLPSDLEALAGQHGRTERRFVADGVQGPTGSGGHAQEAWDIWKRNRPIGNGERDNQFFTLAKLMQANGLIYANACEEVMSIYEHKVLDRQGFSMDDALAKVKRVYGR